MIVQLFYSCLERSLNLGFDNGLYYLKSVDFATGRETERRVILWIRNPDQEFLVMIARRRHPKNFADNLDTDIDLLIKVTDVIINYIKS